MHAFDDALTAEALRQRKKTDSVSLRLSGESAGHNSWSQPTQDRRRNL